MIGERVTGLPLLSLALIWLGWEAATQLVHKVIVWLLLGLMLAALYQLSLTQVLIALLVLRMVMQTSSASGLVMKESLRLVVSVVLISFWWAWQTGLVFTPLVGVSGVISFLGVLIVTRQLVWLSETTSQRRWLQGQLYRDTWLQRVVFRK